MSARRYAVVAGGGTGGHVLEALAVARALQAAGHDPSGIEMVGSRRGQEAVLLATAGFPVTLLPGRGIARRMSLRSLVANAGAVAGLMWACGEAVVRVGRWRPSVVVSVGGYAAFPPAAAAVLLRVPLVLVNIDAVPGLVHRVLGRFAAASAVAFPDTPLPRSQVTGTPVRPEVGRVARTPGAAADARRDLDLPPDRKTVAFVGGSLGARQLNRAAATLSRRWAARGDVTLYHVTGRRDWEAMSGPGDAAGTRTEEAPGVVCYRMVPFEDRMPTLYQAADLVVCRAGAVTVAELAVAGVPAVLVPLPGAPGDHQTANARSLEAAGAAVVLEDRDCTGAELARVVGELLDDPDRLAAMGRAARAAGRPDAADRVAALVGASAR